ncbi:DUF362 domain-containing protein [bacterium]|nr:DUF362 domain-containing protein [bacterium]
MAVFLEEMRKYRTSDIVAALERATDSLDLNLSGLRTALIKPNLVTGKNPRSAVVTHPSVTEAVIVFLRERGITEITIADGPGIGLDSDWVFEKSGYTALARRLDVPLVCFNDLPRRARTWKYGEIGVPELLEDVDLYVNIPKLKTHGYSTMTLSIKNHKGMLSQEDKKLDHQLGLHDPLVQQAKLRPADLVVLDGIVGLEGDGPLNGRPIRSGVFAVSTSMLELDAAAARLAGFDPVEIAHLRIAEEEGLGTLDPELLGSAPTHSFVRANEEFGRVANIYSWRDPTACSMCIDSFGGAVSLAVKDPRNWFSLAPKLLYWGLIGKLHILQGRQAVLPEANGKVVCFGKCTRDMAKREGLVHVAGCPPTAQEVAKTLRREL